MSYAACAMAFTRSQVVAAMLGREFIKSSHLPKFGCLDVSGSHSGVARKRSKRGAKRTSARLSASLTKKR